MIIILQPLIVYILFSKLGQIGKILGEKWGKMTADEKKVNKRKMPNHHK